MYLPCEIVLLAGAKVAPTTQTQIVLISFTAEL